MKRLGIVIFGILIISLSGCATQPEPTLLSNQKYIEIATSYVLKSKQYPLMNLEPLSTESRLERDSNGNPVVLLSFSEKNDPDKHWEFWVEMSAVGEIVSTRKRLISGPL